ncbi:hypothetical protein USDA257_c56540 [Sinorhizobium fredii USDA 257]|uniref:Uncharacterized protein n=1 Tax=Sinorhizobium fredii (strain USDA 257) TaxID=1185652 RepID=I3XE61_SINF2|nr:hypothetical protein USDA257_c56540 [Sinorhizobium fredii USDA 257]
MAGLLAHQAGLAIQSGSRPFDPVAFESALQPGMHIVGDAIIGGVCRNPPSALTAGPKPAPLPSRPISPNQRVSRRICSTPAAPFSARRCVQQRHQLQARRREAQESHRVCQQGRGKLRGRWQAALAAEAGNDAFTHHVFG